MNYKKIFFLFWTLFLINTSVTCKLNAMAGEVHAGAYLEYHDLHNRDFTGLNLTNIFLRGAFLKRTILKNVNLTRAYLGGADLRDADLSQAYLESTDLTSVRHLQTTKVSGARFVNVIGLSDADRAWLRANGATVITIAEEVEPCPVCSKEFVAHDTTIRLLRCGHAFCFACMNAWWKSPLQAEQHTCPCCREELNTFDEPVLFDDIKPGANLAARCLGKIYLEARDLTDANLEFADLTKTCLKRACLHNACLSLTKIADADLTGADLTDAKFVQASFSGVCLANANLTHANFIQAYFDEVNFTGAQNLQTTLVSGAIFTNPIGLSDDDIEWLKWHGATVKFDGPDDVEGEGVEAPSVLPTSVLKKKAYVATAHLAYPLQTRRTHALSASF